MRIGDVNVRIAPIEGAPACIVLFEIFCRHGSGGRGTTESVRITEEGELLHDPSMAALSRTSVIQAFLRDFGRQTYRHPSCACWDALVLRYGPEHSVDDLACPFHGIQEN